MKNTNQGCLKTIALFLLTISAVLLGGLSVSKWFDSKHRREVDKNGMYLKAIVLRKTSNSKGRTTYFKFYFKNKEFVTNDDGHDLFDKFSIGDTITLKIDTLNPTNAYAVIKPD